MSALLQGTNQGKFLKKILHTSQYVLKKSFTFAGPLAVAHFEGGKSSSFVRIITSHIMVSHHHESTLFFSGFKHYLGSEFLSSTGLVCSTPTSYLF